MFRKTFFAAPLGYLYVMLCILPLLLPNGARAMPTADQVVRDTAQQLIDALKKNREQLRKEPQKIYELIEHIAVPHFDIPYIVRLVLGGAWRKATPQQRERFTTAFRTFVINNYAKALLQYSNETLTVYPVSPEQQNGKRVMVRSRLTGGGEAPVAINYRMHVRDGEWKVYDVIVSGVSIVINYRNSFAEQIRDGGLDSLIDLIEQKNAAFRLEDDEHS